MHKSEPTFVRFFHGRADMQSLGLRVLACGKITWELMASTGYTIRDARHHRYVLCVVLAGEASLTLGSLGRFPVSQGQFFLVLPNEGYTVDEISEDWSHAFCSFDGETLEKAFAQGRFRDRTPKVTLSPEGHEIWGRIVDGGRSGIPQRERRLPSLLHCLLDELWQAPTGRTTADERLQVWVETFARTPERPWDLQEVARQAGLSDSLFRRRFKALTGVAPMPFILRARINLACRYLAEGHNVSQAADATGFQSPFYFSRVFKRFTGVPPSRYTARK